MEAKQPQPWRLVFGEHEPGLTIEEVARNSDVRFVRGKAQLATYNSRYGQTGHILTALEALRTFGLEVLTESAEYGAAVILGNRGDIESALCKGRENLGLDREIVAQISGLGIDDVVWAETEPAKMPIQILEHIAFVLGLDERKIAFSPTSGADTRLAFRLRNLGTEPILEDDSLPDTTILSLAEASSLIRTQVRIQRELGIVSRLQEFGSLNAAAINRSQSPWMAGCELAERTRQLLGLGSRPIDSVRKFVEETLGIPVIQTTLQTRVAGATLTIDNDNGTSCRGIVLNSAGLNSDLWERRTTLAHQAAHILFDPEDSLDKVHLDSYDANEIDPKGPCSSDTSELRAVAFVNALLVPPDELRKRVQLAPWPADYPEGIKESIDVRTARMLTGPRGHIPATTTSILGHSVSEIVHEFGISQRAVRVHISNCADAGLVMPTDDEIPAALPTCEQIQNEETRSGKFPIASTPIQRQGRFASMVVAAYECSLLSEQTAAAYLTCEVSDFQNALVQIRRI